MFRQEFEFIEAVTARVLETKEAPNLMAYLEKFKRFFKWFIRG